MGLVRRVALAILLISFIVFVALFGRLPALRSTPIGALHRLLLHRLPSALQYADQRLTRGRLTASAARLGHHLLNERHPVILIGFLTLLTASATLFLYTAWSLIPTSPHHYTIPPLLILPYLFTYLCATSRAAHLTPHSDASKTKRYPYDHTLYHPNITCSTCKIPKPARSKHCALCNTCISRHDHHCVWVNNCIGYGNYGYFLGLLASLGVLLSYGAYIAYRILQTSRAWRARGSWFERFGLAVAMNLNVGAVGLLAGLTAPLAWGLLVYHIYLVWAGMTTNETAKWSGLRVDIRDGLVWKGRRRVGEEVDGGDSGISGRGWPKRSDQIVVIMRDERHPDALHLEGVETPSWMRIGSLDDVHNIYDAGFWRNLVDCLDIRQ